MPLIFALLIALTLTGCIHNRNVPTETYHVEIDSIKSQKVAITRGGDGHLEFIVHNNTDALLFISHCQYIQPEKFDDWNYIPSSEQHLHAGDRHPASFQAVAPGQSRPVLFFDLYLFAYVEISDGKEWSYIQITRLNESGI